MRNIAILNPADLFDSLAVLEKLIEGKNFIKTVSAQKKANYEQEVLDLQLSRNKKAFALNYITFIILKAKILKD